MRKVRVKYFAIVFLLVVSVTTSSITVSAAGLTQAANPEKVAYGVLSDRQIELLGTIFDADYYLTQNPDLEYLLGSDYEELFNHFVKCGLFEGRVCNANFDPSAYASAYADLKESFGSDIYRYYEHYLLNGVTENRTVTTIAECAKNGISVQSLANSEVVITPQAYYIAEYLGVLDYTIVQNAINAAYETAASSSQPVSIGSGNKSVTIKPNINDGNVNSITAGESQSETSASENKEEDKGLDALVLEMHELPSFANYKAAQYDLDGQYLTSIHIIQGKVGYGLYILTITDQVYEDVNGSRLEIESELISSTDGYEAPEKIDEYWGEVQYDINKGSIGMEIIYGQHNDENYTDSWQGVNHKSSTILFTYNQKLIEHVSTGDADLHQTFDIPQIGDDGIVYDADGQIVYLQYPLYYDPSGDKETSYEIVAGIEFVDSVEVTDDESEDGSYKVYKERVNITIGDYNDENNFAYKDTWQMTYDRTVWQSENDDNEDGEEIDGE